MIAYCWTAWVVSGDFTPNTLGRGLEPLWYVILVRCVEVIFGILVTGWLLWHYVVKPKIRTRQFTFTGLYFMAGFLMSFQEPWINWTSYQFLYATTFVNFGSWLPHIPGWSSPNGQIIPMPLVYFTAYLWMSAMAGYLGSLYMSRMRGRNPGVGNGRLLAQTAAIMLLADVVLELIMTRTQLISYGTTVERLTLFAGTDHQFPIYEPFHWAGTWLLLSCIHFFRDDRGLSIPERGVEKIVKSKGKLNTFARFVALVGACQLTILFAFNIPYQLWALHSGPMPKSLVTKEWRTAGVCGPSTAYACPDPRLPIAREGSPTNRIPGAG